MRLEAKHGTQILADGLNWGSVCLQQAQAIPSSIEIALAILGHIHVVTWLCLLTATDTCASPPWREAPHARAHGANRHADEQYSKQELMRLR